MRRAWPLALGAAIVAAAVLSYRSARVAPSPESASRAGSTFEGAPTNRPPERGRNEELAPGVEDLVELWRVTVLRKDVRNWNAAREAVLGKWAEAKPLVRNLAENDRSDRVRAVNLRLLAERAAPAEAPFFAERLERDSSPFVRENACWALARLKAVEYRGLLERFESDPEKRVADAATAALLEMK